ncbi:MAG: hypothetical protein CM1200mP21_08390 [Candidatus Poseidoniales archaeon]|nr:MAG: hypothetical protein CM1200mP21_08390 [Candidatus Poseidoniales archaeon]
MGREKGQSLPSNAGGVLAVLAAFFIPRTSRQSIVDGRSLGTDDAMFASGRLAILAVLIHMATKMQVDSILLEWVRGFP